MVVDVDGSIKWSCIMVTTSIRNDVSNKLRHVAPIHLDVLSSTCCTIRDRLCCAHSHSSSGLRSSSVLFCEFPLHIRMMVIPEIISNFAQLCLNLSFEYSSCSIEFGISKSSRSREMQQSYLDTFYSQLVVSCFASFRNKSQSVFRPD